ncbi:MAG: NAD-dependent aldehyde dehydrogenase [Armatimonadetes bacterium OLB18]|nr:MAG: NAD-dependent aldehyde dehydrogenase [Armatimonadetes bacterium OLB18]
MGGEEIAQPPNAEVVEVHSPWDPKWIGRSFLAGRELVEDAVESSLRAFEVWRRSSPKERSSLLTRIADEIARRKERLAELLVFEIGKPIVWAEGEIARLEITFRLAAQLASIERPQTLDLSYDPRGKDFAGSVQREPRGPVLAFVPYNWPYNLAAHKLAPALATGNTVLLKPSPLAPISSLELVRLIHDVGCPAGVVNAMNLSNDDAQWLAQHDGVKLLSFTGSPRVGWFLKSLVPRKPVVLELGGDASVIVWEDADLEWATQRIVASAYGYAGQVCISAQHVVASAGVLDQLKVRLTEATRVLQDRLAARPRHRLRADDLRERGARVEAWVEEALKGGANLLAGGVRNGTWYPPTLVENAPPESKLGCEEVFGPVLTLVGVDSLDEALARVNSSKYGIHASLFTQSEEVVRACHDNLEVAGLIVNDAPTIRFDGMPYGGIKDSGVGREGVAHAMEAMTEPKVLLQRA